MFVFYCTRAIDPAKCTANQVTTANHRTNIKTPLKAALLAISQLEN